MSSRAKVYLSSAVALCVAVQLRLLLDPILGDALPLVTLFGAIAAAVFLGGHRPAIAVSLLGYVACAYLFIPPRGYLGLDVAGNGVGFVAYLFTSALIIGIGSAARSARNRLARERQLLQVTLSSIGDAVITTDTEGRISSLNKVAESLTGWPRHDALGQPLEEVFRIFNETTRQPVESPVRRALRDGTVVGLANHTLLVRRDGSEMAIDDSAAPIRDEKGVVSGCVLIFRDVTAERQAAREKASQLLTARLLASIVESSDDAIISKRVDGRIQSWNAGAERLFGYSPAEAVGRKISLIIPPERMAEEEQIIGRLKAGQRIDHFETERVGRDGRRFQVSLTISPLRDEAGQVVGASKIARDVTERKRLENDLRRLAADLSEADRRKDEFLATLAHELRNPLAPLVNMVEVLKLAEGDPELQRRARETIERQLGQLVRLVDDLLDLNRITHNRLELRLGDVELEAVIQQAVEVVRPLADAVGHDLQVTLPEESVHLHADPARLAQVFGNLLNNSSRYTPPGGRIWVTAERSGTDVEVIVGDTGSGIPADKLESIFEMFAQADGSTDQPQGGLGIGLTLVRQLVQMHGGSVVARSAGAGRGSEFVVRLPVAVAKAAPAPAPPAPRAPSQRRRILIVDDNEDAAESLALLLAAAGHETHVAHDGVAAVEAAERLRPDAVLLDIGLPKLSGYEACRRIRQQPWARDILLVALTGWGQVDDRRKSEEAGFDDHLVKPVNHGVLIEMLAARVGAAD